MLHSANWYAGWSMVLAAFLSGSLLGLGFAREEFLGGYASWRRRLIRLGHIALAALGLMNVVYSTAPAIGWQSHGAAVGLMAGGVAMPLICFLSAWKKPLKCLFFIPVAALTIAVALILMG